MLHVRSLKAKAVLGALALTFEAQAAAPATSADSPRDNPDKTHESDGVYGRLDGDLDLGLGVGAELEAGEMRGAARLTAHYFAIAGVYAAYRDQFRTGDEIPSRVVSFGVDMRPVFVPRWARNMEYGPAFVDLWLDSISVSMGAFWQEPPGHDFGSERGFELSFGFGLPLFGTGPGLWLEARGSLRWPDHAERADSALIALSWHSFVLTPFSTLE